MNISYKKLFEILRKKNISKTTLGKSLDLSSATLAKLSKNEQISMNTLISICDYLNCQPGDIMEFERDSQKNNLLFRLQEEKEVRLKGSIYHQTQIKLAYNSNHIEGSRLTEDQTRYIYETNTVGLEKEPANVDDIMETINHFQCFDYMIDCANDTLSEEFIKTTHKILKTNTSDSRLPWFNVGEYKAKKNMVGDMETTSPENVEREIRNLLNEYNKKQGISFDDILDFHVKFEFYYRGLKEWNNEKGYLRDTCLTAQDRYKVYLDYFEIEYE